MNENNNLQSTFENLPLHSPDDVDLKIFNTIKSPDNNNGKPIKAANSGDKSSKHPFQTAGFNW